MATKILCIRFRADLSLVGLTHGGTACFTFDAMLNGGCMKRFTSLRMTLLFDYLVPTRSFSSSSSVYSTIAYRVICVILISSRMSMRLAYLDFSMGLTRTIN